MKKEEIIINNNNKITVINSKMNYAEKEWLAHFAREKERQWNRIIYVANNSQTLQEIEHDPMYSYTDYPSKKTLKRCKKALREGYDLAITYKILKTSNKKFYEYISNRETTLIIDDSIDMFEVWDKRAQIERREYGSSYDDYCRKTVEDTTLSNGDMEFLFKVNTIDLDENNYITWIYEKKYGRGCNFYDIKLAAKNKCLIKCNANKEDGEHYIYQFSPVLLDLFKEIYIISPDFNNSLTKTYLDMHNLGYDIKKLSNDSENYTLIDSQGENIVDTNIKNLITICEDDDLNQIGDEDDALSYEWYKSKSSDELSVLKDNIDKFIKMNKSCKLKDVMWTTFDEYEESLTNIDRQYIKKPGVRQLEKLLRIENPWNSDDEILKLKCFVPYNSISNTFYTDRTVLIYTTNDYFEPIISNFVEERGISINKDHLALQNIIKWVYKSAIKDNKPVSIYIPSSRMRRLFKEWLNTPIEKGDKPHIDQ